MGKIVNLLSKSMKLLLRLLSQLLGLLRQDSRARGLVLLAIFVAILSACAVLWEIRIRAEGRLEGMDAFRAEAVERGCAVWEVVDQTTGASEFRWVHAKTNISSGLLWVDGS